MDRAEVHGLVDALLGVDERCRERGELASAVAAVARVRAWLDSREVALARQLAEVAACPEQVLVEKGRSSARQANLVLERVRTVQALPEVASVLAAGHVSAGHVDAMTRALRRLEPAQRPQLTDRAAWLAEVAARTTPDELERTLASAVRRIMAADGMRRLERQRRAIRLRTWVDADGMWCLAGRFDPESGVELHQSLAATVAHLFAEQTPEDAPTDPVERQSFLLARALAHLLTNGHPTRRARGPGEVVVVVDATAPDVDGEATVDWGLPVELPSEVLRDHFDTARVRPVVVRHGVVLHAPGQLDLGRATRLANRAQRRALRALYPTCAIPGCPTRYEHCKLHHVHWWEHGGATDLANLLPLCVRHHHAVHDQGWQLTLRPDRQLTILYPDGTEQTTGPPRRGTPHRAPPPPASADRVAPEEPVAPVHPSDRFQPLLL